QANRASAAGDRGQPDERRRIECSIVVVLAEPHRVEPRRFGALALADGLLEIAPGLQRAQAEPHVDVLLVHRPPPTPAAAPAPPPSRRVSRNPPRPSNGLKPNLMSMSSSSTAAPRSRACRVGGLLLTFCHCEASVTTLAARPGARKICAQSPDIAP